MSHWGDIESEDEESEEEEEEEPMGVEDAVPDDVASLDGMSSVATGVSSLPSGLETPEVLDLRKAKAGGGRSCCFLACSLGCWAAVGGFCWAWSCAQAVLWAG